MLDKKQFDLEMLQARTDQVKDLMEYLTDFIAQNANIRTMKIEQDVNESDMQKIADIPISTEGRDVKEVARELIENVLSRRLSIHHPRFFSFVPSAVSPYSLLGTVLTDIYNANGGGWAFAPEACLIEEKLIKWIAGLAGYSQENCGGLFLSGGSMSNMSALITARSCKLDENDYPLGVAYISDQSHSSVVKGLRLIGLRRDQIVCIETDDDFKIRLDLLEEAIKSDIAAGKKPFIVVGTIGTTNTGSIDPLPELGEICQRNNLWFHVDGAYGGSILLSDIYRHYAAGLEKSDSFSWDLHKWALQTYSCSAFIVKDRNNLLDTFSEHPEYLEDVRTHEHADPWDLGPELSRPHRALKFWVTLQTMGTDLYADVIDYSFYNAKLAQNRLLSYPNWQLTSKPMCCALTFRYVPEGWCDEKVDKLTAAISRKINEDGFAYIVTSVIKNKRVLRMCLINGNTTEDDVVETVDYMDKIARELAEKMK